MPRYYEPDLTVDPNSPFVRDSANKLVRRGISPLNRGSNFFSTRMASGIRLMSNGYHLMNARTDGVTLGECDLNFLT